jgi:pimeloyl-ACP methyl ester carboxylesterase
MAWVPGWDDRYLGQVLWREDAAEVGAEMMFRERWGAMSADQRARRVKEARAFVAEEKSVRTDRDPFDLSALQVPLVYGYADSYRFTVVPDYLRRTVRQLEVVQLDGAGHNAHRTRPDAFADLVCLGLHQAKRVQEP